ncbi:iron-containing alcohol dehydrogenase [Geoalkalibacter halelectricus]|uniref:Iron-containing alcohol dehydrogenase n=1 Tax=Geoalkalibacter halelectricus TaxID=2847045 RepID=A0ABY5ZLQ3_9BACT|nr:iron-containing alcohol dehydrogenase [Geoalkalibacter halelectricus]UWZ78892.1 iron-containing alcohol dehydrogenase [Geoalkalibacter halelectricus]
MGHEASNKNSALHHCKFEVPEIIFGRGLLNQIGSCARRLGGNKVFLVSDQGLFNAGWVDRAMHSLLEAGLNFVYFDQITSNPKDHEVEAGAREYIRQGADVIVGLGGGSAMDAAKGIAILVSNGGNIRDFEGSDKISRPLPPLVLCPTTCGTGSDVSQFAIVNDTQRHCKMTIMSRCVAPDISLTDPETLTTLPEEYICTTATDALSHALEAYFSVASSTLTDVNAIRALSLLSDGLVQAVREQLVDDLEKMARASLHAGMAFSNSLLGIVHALAHPIGGLYDINHGSVNAVLLPEVVRYDLPVVTEKLPELAWTLGVRKELTERDAAEVVEEKIEHMLDAAGAPRTLSSLGVKREDLPQLARQALSDVCILTSPRAADEGDLLRILERAF